MSAEETAMFEKASRVVQIRGKELLFPSLDLKDEAMFKELQDQLSEDDGILALVCTKEIIQTGEKVWNYAYPTTDFHQSMLKYPGKTPLVDHKVLGFPENAEKLGIMRKLAKFQGGSFQAFEISPEQIRQMVDEQLPIWNIVNHPGRMNDWGLT